MGAFLRLAGLTAAGLFIVACSNTSDRDVAVEDIELEYETANNGPSLPPPPPGATCALIQRGTLGNVWDTDISLANGTKWAAGGQTSTWTGLSNNVHWSVYQFDLGVVPANAVIVSATFTNYVSWNANNSTVRAHRVLSAWSEATANWSNFTNNGTTTNYDPAVVNSYVPVGSGWKSMDVTSLVQAWHGGAVPNNGMLLEEDPILKHMYISSESVTVAKRPSLQVCWTDPPADVCADPGEPCSAATPCCDGICNDGVCPTPGGGGGGPVCAQPGDICNAATPCCDGICNDGICPGAGGGGGQCIADGEACGANADCCSGSCFDGACIATNQCLQVDEEGSCSPANPCCGGAHCVFNICFALEDIQSCSIKNGPCDDATQWCCWGMTCGADGLCH